MEEGKPIDDPWARATQVGLQHYPQFGSHKAVENWIEKNHGKIDENGKWIK